MHVKESVQCRSGAVAVELQVELWGSPGPEAVTCWPSAHNKGPGDLWLGQGAGHGDTAGAEDPRLLCPDCEGIKAKGFLFIGPPPQRNQLELLFSYLVIAPGWNYFKNLSVWDSAMETLGLSPYGKPECVCVCVSCRASVQLRWCTRVTVTVILDAQQGSFLESHLKVSPLISDISFISCCCSAGFAYTFHPSCHPQI